MNLIKKRVRVKIVIFNEKLAIVELLLIVTLPISSASALNQYTYSLVYDGNGNLITGDGKYREYNEFNQLVRVREGDTASGKILETYVYDPSGDRILAKYTDYDDATNSSYNGAVVYVNDNFERVYELKSGQKSNDTYYARDESGIIGEENTNSSGAIVKKSYYHPDPLGSTTLITNSSGEVVENTFYDPYGQILVGGEASRYQYEGKEFSEATQDYDFHFRKYNPQIGIFTQPEQIFPSLYDPQQLNRYRFERNNPYKYVDPTGKYGVLIFAAAIGVIMLVDYGLEIYHGIIEGATLSESYEAGALRSGQEVGGVLIDPRETGKFLVGLVFEYPSDILTGIEIYKEISSGRKSSYLKRSDEQNQQVLPLSPNALILRAFSMSGGFGNLLQSYSKPLAGSGVYYIDNVRYQANRRDASGDYYCGRDIQTDAGGTTTGGSMGIRLPSIVKTPFSTKPKNPGCGKYMSCAS